MPKYVDSNGDEVEAVLFTEDNRPDNVAPKKKVIEKKVTINSKGVPEINDEEHERYFIATKDKDGDYSVKEAVSSVEPGNWIITHSDGSVSLCSPVVFKQQYKEAK